MMLWDGGWGEKRSKGLGWGEEEEEMEEEGEGDEKGGGRKGVKTILAKLPTAYQTTHIERRTHCPVGRSPI